MVDYSRFDGIGDSDSDEEENQIQSLTTQTSEDKVPQGEQKEGFSKLTKSQEGKEGRHAFCHGEQLGFYDFFFFSIIFDLLNSL